jgi:hypothetical protein
MGKKETAKKTAAPKESKVDDTRIKELEARVYDLEEFVLKMTPPEGETLVLQRQLRARIADHR